MTSLKPTIDPSFYNLQPDEIAFFQQLTGIKDEGELKQHILNVQAKAYDVPHNFTISRLRNAHKGGLQIYGYPCIRRFGFTRYI